jgi:hypothetical protein
MEGQEVSFTAAVMVEGVPEPQATGTIAFRVDGDLVASETVVDGEASFSTSSLTAGGRSITATYSGDAT